MQRHCKPWENDCDTCRKISLVADKGCLKCGRLLLNEEKEYCEDCMRMKRCIVRSLTGYDYRQEWVHKMIFHVKYHNERQLLDYLAARQLMSIEILLCDGSVIA